LAFKEQLRLEFLIISNISKFEINALACGRASGNVKIRSHRQYGTAGVTPALHNVGARLL